MSDPDFPHPDSEGSSDDAPFIQFFSEDIDFELVRFGSIADWLHRVLVAEGKSPKGITFVFCSDEYLHRLNTQYLQHDTYTDVITFPYSEGEEVEGDIFISVDRVRENAQAFQSTFEGELLRVMVHGVLHLCGYRDKEEEDRLEIREKENQYLRFWAGGPGGIIL